MDAPLSRWLWLVKWFLAIPHYFVLAFLWIAFFVLTVVAFFAILFTGRYPRGIFDFNLGVLRWTWRVDYYALGAAATDRYPPFTLDEVPDYPATLHIDYPGELSRGLALVKWWLLAIPHYLVVSFFVGSGVYVASQADQWDYRYSGWNLLGLLVFFAVVQLLFTGRYPGGLFDLVLGLNRWVIRVVGYAALMTDDYPPFRLDMGGPDPGTLAMSSPNPGSQETPVGPGTPAPGMAPTGPPTGPPTTQRAPMTGGRIVAIVIGAFLILIGLPLLPAGVAAITIDQTQRDSNGLLLTGSEQVTTATYALNSEVLDVDLEGPDWIIDPASAWVGDIAVQVTPQGDEPVFVGVARQADVADYLGDVEHDVVSGVNMTPFRIDYDRQPGGEPESPPGDQQFWSHETTGTTEQTLRWNLEDGRWNIVVMNADASRSVTVDMRVGGEFPALGWLGVLFLVSSVILLAGGAVLLYVGLRSRPRPAQV